MKSTTQSSPSGRRLLTVIKQPVQTIAFTNINLIAPPASISGRTLQAEDRVLLTAQTETDENGIYGFDGDELKPAIDWLNEEGQEISVIAGSNIGKKYLFTNGAWSSIGGSVVIVTADGQSVEAETIIACPGITNRSDGVHIFEGGQDANWDTLGSDTSTPIMDVVITGLDPDSYYNATLTVSCVFYEVGNAENSGSIDGSVDLFILTDADSLATTNPQSSLIPDPSRLPTAIINSTFSVVPISGGFRISATRHSGVNSYVKAFFWIRQFVKLDAS